MIIMVYNNRIVDCLKEVFFQKNGDKHPLGFLNVVNKELHVGGSKITCKFKDVITKLLI